MIYTFMILIVQLLVTIKMHVTCIRIKNIIMVVWNVMCSLVCTLYVPYPYIRLYLHLYSKSTKAYW